ncbi:MAG: glycosyltransferase [Bacteroidetes bacterium]|nr:glycosyltransferase [Bacteroidota bacterium]
MKEQKVLYISYDGMTDPLGRSQVIPYLIGLSATGIRFTLMSFEKPERYEKGKEAISSLLEYHHIKWIPQTYTKRPPILSTLWDVWQMRRAAEREYESKAYDIVHCRSYISALVGLWLKKRYGVKMIFDMRGFWADERIDGGIWPRDRQPYKAIYSFFKKKEKEYLLTADQIISLTDNAQQEMQSWQLCASPLPVTVIPCCTDLSKFDPDKIDHPQRTKLKAQLDIGDQDIIISYLGSLGTWYMLDEMLDFFAVALKTHPHLRFLFITADAPGIVYDRASRKNIPKEKIIVAESPYDQVATYLSLSQIAVFFIKPAYSKKASSPTKQGELMAMGIPMICNKGVGDVDHIIEDTQAGIALEAFTPAAYAYAAAQIDRLLTMDRTHIQQGGYHYYALSEGVKKYKGVYDRLKDING